MYQYIDSNCPECHGSGRVTVYTGIGDHEETCSCVREIDEATATSMLLSRITAPESNEALLALISEYGDQMHRAGMFIDSKAGREMENVAKSKFELIATHIRLCMQLKESA